MIERQRSAFQGSGGKREGGLERKTWSKVIGTGSQLVPLFFQILDRLVLLFKRFVRGKNMGSVELQSEGMLPGRKDLLLFFAPESWTDVFDAYLSSAVFAR